MATMHATTSHLLDMYREHLSELVADGRMSESEAASATFYAEHAAAGTDPFTAASDEAERVIRDA